MTKYIPCYFSLDILFLTTVRGKQPDVFPGLHQKMHYPKYSFEIFSAVFIENDLFEQGIMKTLFSG